jgi:hypothetical protein
MNRGMIDRYAALVHHLFEIPQAQWVGHVPTHADQHDLQREPQPLYHALRRTHNHRRFASQVRATPVTRQSPAKPITTGLLREVTEMQVKAGLGPCTTPKGSEKLSYARSSTHHPLSCQADM